MLNPKTIELSLTGFVALFTILEIIFAANSRNEKIYTLKDTLYNIYLTLFNIAISLLMLGFTLRVLNFFYQYKWIDLSFKPLVYWVALIIALDFVYYILHAADHFIRFFWAVHVTHHNSNYFNLTTGFRSSVFQPIYRFIYFIPLAMCGFKAIDIIFIHTLLQTWGILVHTKHINKCHPIIEYIFVTPSHHRVHHGSNEEYIDKNMGMFLIIWDRIFGTFQAELDEVKVRYGITKSIEPINPISVWTHEWTDIWRDVKLAPNYLTKLKVILYPPGWFENNKK